MIRLTVRPMRRAVLVLAVLALAGCGGSKHAATTSTGAATASGPPAAELRRLLGTSTATVRAAGGRWWVAWAVVGGRARTGVLERGPGGWRSVAGAAIGWTPLGPQPGGHAAAVPQVAVEIKAPSPIVDTALWVDGRPIDTRGGGLTTKLITIYGAPAAPLGTGRHVVVAFARAGTTASAAAWLFTVP